MSRTNWMAFLSLTAAITAVFLLFLFPAPVQAAGVVGSGTAASCTEAALNTALSGGGTVTFNCGGGNKTIILTTPKTIAANTTINGGGLITLSGGNTIRHFLINSGIRLTLDNITLSNGYSNTGDGGAIFNGYGVLQINNSTLRNNNTSSNWSGGAIVSYGPMTITNSILNNNSGGNGGAVYPRLSAARTIIINSTLHHNSTTNTTNGWGGALLSWGSPVTIQNSEIYSNSARGGGAIYSIGGSFTTLNGNSQVWGNTVLGVGAIYNAGTAHFTNIVVRDNIGSGIHNNGGNVTLTNSTLERNNAGLAQGGGFSNHTGVVTLTNVILSRNNAALGGGFASTDSTRTIRLTNLTVISNTASDGGGIYSFGNPIILNNSTFTGNMTTGEGGGYLNKNGARATVTNSTFHNNTGTAQGGGLMNFIATAVLTNVTFSNNNSTFGAGLVNDLGNVTLTNVTIQGSQGTAFIHYSWAGGDSSMSLLKNTILAYAPGGTNCYILNQGGASLITSTGFNLSNDTSCNAYFNQGGDKNNVNPLLSPLANNGGPTPTHLLQSGSQARDGGAGIGCPATDQRGAPRPQEAACDMGAVEMWPLGTLTAVLLTPATARISWIDTVYDNYQLQRSSEPYSGFASYQVVNGTQYDETAGVTNPAANYYYQIYGDTGGTGSGVGESTANTVGVFTFAIQPGS